MTRQLLTRLEVDAAFRPGELAQDRRVDERHRRQIDHHRPAPSEDRIQAVAEIADCRRVVLASEFDYP